VFGRHVGARRASLTARGGGGGTAQKKEDERSEKGNGQEAKRERGAGDGWVGTVVSAWGEGEVELRTEKQKKNGLKNRRN